MANSPQAKKRARQADVRKKHNASQRSLYRTSIKKIQAAIATNDHATAQAAYERSVAIMDRMTAKGIVHKRKTDRYKSRLNTRVKALVVQQSAPA